MRRRILSIAILILALLVLGEVAARAEPPRQEGEPVYGLLGTLRPGTTNRYATELVTASQIYPIVGESPTIEQRIQRIRTQDPPVTVRVWGRLVDSLDQPNTQQIVATAVLIVDETPVPDLPIAVVQARANMRAAPSADADVVAPVYAGDEFDIVARDASNRWWRICCVDGEYGWILQSAIATEGDTGAVPVFQPRIRFLPLVSPGQSAPTPTPRALPDTSWRAAYFDNVSLEGDPIFVTRVNAVSFDWGDNSPVPGVVPADNFSARFERMLTLEDGFYEFTVQADDGVAVWIGGDLVVNEWHMAEPPEYQFGRQLTGPTPVRIEYFEAGGQAAVRFEYRLVTEFPDWKASYFNVIDLAGGPQWIQAEPRGPTLDLSRYWSLDSPVPGVIPADNWSARWEGTYFFEGGNYVFWARADDGVRLWIDDILVLDAWEDSAGYVEELFYGIGPGDHTVRIEYYERGGIARIEANWTNLGQPSSIMP